MSVIIETSKGDLVIDLYTSLCPVATKSFLKLCKIKYYNNCLFHNIQKDFLIQTGDPTNTGKGGESIYGVLYGEQAKYFDDEIIQTVKHTKKGTVAMASAGKNMNGSQFYITVLPELHQLDGQHTIIGEVAEGLEVLDKINEVFTDSEGKPLEAVRIKHTIIMEDPFEDPKELVIPDKSPVPPREYWGTLLDEDEIEQLGKPDSRSEKEIQEELKTKEAKTNAEVLEMLGDLPDAEVKPPDNVLFICKLNPVTNDEDLELIFSRFGEIRSCEVVKDWKTGESLCYAFVEFATPEQAEQAYFKMDNVLIDDRRIHVDFSQSVSKLVMGRDGKTVRVMNKNFWKGSTGRAPAPRERDSGNKNKRESNIAIKSNNRDTGNYKMVFDAEDSRDSRDSKRKSDDKHHHSSSSRSEKKHRRSRSRSRERKRETSRRDRSRSRSRERRRH